MQWKGKIILGFLAIVPLLNLYLYRLYISSIHPSMDPRIGRGPSVMLGDESRYDEDEHRKEGEEKEKWRNLNPKLEREIAAREMEEERLKLEEKKLKLAIKEKKIAAKTLEMSPAVKMSPERAALETAILNRHVDSTKRQYEGLDFNEIFSFDSSRDLGDCAEAILARDLQHIMSEELIQIGQLLMWWMKRYEEADKVLVAGDSLIHNWMEGLRCSSILLGNRNPTATVMRRYDWNAADLNDHLPIAVDVSKDGFNSLELGNRFLGGRDTTQGILTRYPFDFGNGNKFVVDYLRFYDLKTDELLPKDPSKRRLVFMTTSFCNFVRLGRFSSVYMNSAHLGLTKGDFATEMKGVMQGLETCKDKLVFLDHAPQHFDTDSGAYHKKDVASTQRPCSCSIPEEMIRQQHARRNNLSFRQIAFAQDVPYVAFFDDMVDLCDDHYTINPAATSSDCTHYKFSPSVWAPLSNRVLKLGMEGKKVL